jgi:hypothetical protein
MPSKSIQCITLETNRWHNQMGNAPQPSDRVKYAKDIYLPMQVTIEPIMDFDLAEFIEMIKTVKPYKVNIGADTGKNNLSEPVPEKIHQLIVQLKKYTEVHQKQNLRRLYEL